MRITHGVAALFLGALAGALAAVSHAALPPIGLVVAVIGSFAIVRLTLLRTGWRPAPVIAALAWVLVIVQGSMTGFSGEIIIWDSTLSSVFLATGALAVVLAAALPMPRSRP